MREVPKDQQWEQPDNPQDTDPAWPVENAEDPFGPENVQVVQAITLMRIYDVLLADFVERHPVAGRKLMERHGKGGLLGPPPAFNPDEVVDYGNG